MDELSNIVTAITTLEQRGKRGEPVSYGMLWSTLQIVKDLALQAQAPQCTDCSALLAAHETERCTACSDAARKRAWYCDGEQVS